MSVLTEVTRLEGAKADIKTAIENKGITVPDELLLDGYAELIENISGGNFEIIGAAEVPTEPKNNTLWVKTEETITSWVIDYKEPEAVEGMVWIGVDFSSEINFNAFASNTLTIYPISCYQYSGEKWTIRGLQIYQNGEWIEIVVDPEVFPAVEPTEYALLNAYQDSTTFEAPESGYFQIEVFGASGRGGYRDVSTMGAGYGTNSGGGGGGGGYACSRIKMKKGDTVILVPGAVGSISSAVINSSMETYDVMQVTSGANGGDGKSNGVDGTNGVGGAGGVATGGNYHNANGGKGGSGNQYTYIEVAGTANATGSINGGSGGAAGYTGGNKGGAGAQGGSSGKGTPGAGSAGFIKIYRGNTNDVA